MQSAISLWPSLPTLHLHTVLIRLLTLLTISSYFSSMMNVSSYSLFPLFPPFPDDVRQLQVNIPHSGLAFAPLGSSVTIPCSVSLSSTSSPLPPRIKWTVVSNGVETQILVARDHRVKINEVYRDRVALLNYTSSPDDLSLWLGDLRASDSGHYRCEVQQGLEDASDLIQLKIKGNERKGVNLPSSSSLCGSLTADFNDMPSAPCVRHYLVF